MAVTLTALYSLMMVLPGRAAAGTPAAVDKRPNIIVILADDMGYSDLGCLGSEIRTPCLDRMASDGLLMTHCYNTSRCCPSRAALLTGQYQWDAGLGHMNTTRSPWPEYQQALSHNTVTIAELLGQHGYQTAMSGKWHVGDKREDWPDRRGFQQFYGTPKGGGLYFYPSAFYDRPVFRNGRQTEPDEDWYSTDGFTDFAIEYLQACDHSRPFFLYLAYIAPHFPLQAREEDIKRYGGVYDTGYQAIRNARFERQKTLGIVPADSRLSPPATPDWATMDRQQAARCMQVYAAQVDRLDQNVGRLLHVLQEEKLADDTVVMFLSDNGGCATGFNKTPQAEIGSRDSNAAYGHWYNVSNTPYRKAKRQEHEGGILTPLVVRWPAGISESGRLVHHPIHIMDILPTCLALADVAYPTTYEEHTLDPLDGVSFASLLAGDAAPSAERQLCWEHEGNRAIRQGRWKLVALHKEPWELYNLEADPFELDNLAAQRPQVVMRLEAAWRRWADVHGVQPWPLRRSQ